MFLTTIIISVAIIVLDFFATRRLSRGCKYRRWWVAAALTTDVLPIIISLSAMMFADDNTAAVMMVSAWSFFGWMVLSIARIPLNIMALISKKRWAKYSGIAITSCIVLTLFYGMFITRSDYEIRRVDIYSSRLPKSFDGYKIVQISDIHIGTMIDAEEELAEIVELCNREDADMVAFCGDLVNVRYSELTPELADILSQLKARDGVYSVTGNHDIGVYMRNQQQLSVEENTRRLIELQQKMGWNTIEDTTQYVHRGADSIAITGVAFSAKLQEFRHSFDLPYVDLKEAYQGYNTNDFNITISHIPQTWDSMLRDSLSDVTLSGHVHAMQFKIPITERGISPAMWGYKRWSGLYTEQGRHLYINDGIGSVLFPLRVGARPEITVITLRCKE